MVPETPANKPRRKWHLMRWAFVLLALLGGWVVWKHYDFRQAVKKAEDRGWRFTYNDPDVMIRADWRAAFRKKTWSDPRRHLYIPNGTVSERDFDLIRRLQPRKLTIVATFPWRDLSQLKGLSNLTILGLIHCPNLTNIDAFKDMKELTGLGIHDSPILANIDPLKELKNLTDLGLNHCTALTNVDALRELKALKYLSLNECTGLKNLDELHGLTGLEQLFVVGCTGLTKETLDAVTAALWNTKIVAQDEE